MCKTLSWIAVMLLASHTGAIRGDLIVEYVPAALLARTNTHAAVAASPQPGMVLPVAEDRWGKFEAEFGIRQPSRSLVKGTLENAKYQLDRTSLAIREFVDTIRERLRFDYGLSDLGWVPPPHASTGHLLTDTLSNARLQSDIDVKLGENAFIGVKLVLPIGN